MSASSRSLRACSSRTTSAAGVSCPARTTSSVRPCKGRERVFLRTPSPLTQEHHLSGPPHSSLLLIPPHCSLSTLNPPASLVFSLHRFSLSCLPPPSSFSHLHLSFLSPLLPEFEHLQGGWTQFLVEAGCDLVISIDPGALSLSPFPPQARS